jgi:nitroimidazol reductase NimA-like FMN-containing flavoprotein (pyridoxamine 5'-phosphate oxidase superfamily)
MAESVPSSSRPFMPGYGVPRSKKGLLPWSHVVERLEAARHYWVATASLDGRPRARPIDGVVVDGHLYFSGGEVGWMRDLRANPRISVHLESADDVVIIEGRVAWIDRPTELVGRINSVSKARHGWDTAPCWRLEPEVAFAWTNIGKDSTRWIVG